MIWPVRRFRALWELSSLFLSVCWTIWSSTLCFILRLWPFFQHWFFFKGHISAVKMLCVSGSQSLKPLTYLVNRMKIDLLNLDSSLFFSWLLTNIYVGQNENSWGWIIHKLPSPYLLWDLKTNGCRWWDVYRIACMIHRFSSILLTYQPVI